MQNNPQQNVTHRAGFLREALGELRQKLQRRKLRRHLRQQETERTQALARLGKRAWEEKIDLSAFPSLRDRLTILESKSHELADSSTRLQADKSELEQKRQGEVTSFDDRRRPLEEKKQRVDVEQRAASQRLAEKDRAVKQAELRLAELGVQLAALEQKAASASPAPSPQPPSAPSREQQLAEQTRLSEGLQASRSALQSHLEEVNRLAGESRRHGEEIAALESQHQAALSPLDAALDRVRGQLATAAQETTALGTEREEKFRQLGLALYDGKTQEPALSQEVRQIATIDQTRGAMNTSLEASLSLSRAVPRGTMLKFWAVVVLVPALVVGVGYWLYSSITTSRAAGRTSRNLKEIKVPTIGESEKDAMVKAFVESRHNPARAPVSDEQMRTGAVPVLMEDLLTLGSTADPQYLPLLVRVLRSDVPDLRAAAADAIGMIGPTADQTSALTTVLNDPVPAVRQSAAQALRASADPYARDLVARARQDRGGGYTAEPLPGDQELGVPVYPGARFLYFASNLNAGRAAFATSDETASVLSFYAGKAQRSPLTLEEAAQASSEASDAGVVRGIDDYRTQRLYGNPMIVIFPETASGGVKLPTHFAVVFEDRVLKQTGFVLHFAPPPTPPPPGGDAGAIEQ